MQEVHNGSYEEVELAIYKNGSLVDADGAVIVNITDADTGHTLLSSGSATNVPLTGMYTFELTPDITDQDCVLKINWSYQISGKNSSQNSFVSVITPYATVSDIIQYYSIGTKPSDLNYVSEQEIINAERIARAQINYYTFQNFGKRYGTQEQFGSGSDAIELTESMVSIDKVYENGVLAIDYTASPTYNNFGYDVELSPTKKVARIVSTFGDVRYDNQVDPTIMYYGRFRDQSRYTFEGEIGYNYVPQDIKLCSTMLIGDLLAHDAEWRKKYLTKVNLAEVSFELSKGAFSGTGNVIVDGILDQFLNLGIIVI